MTDNESAVQAPWTPEQVDALNRWQQAGHVPGFTCGICRDRDTDAEVARFEAAGEPDDWQWTRTPEHALVATPDGWVCETCDYTQDWAWRHMTGPVPRPWWEIVNEHRKD